jgi:hypothetical protein
MYMDGRWLPYLAPVAAVAIAGDAAARRLAAKRQDELLDLALVETFPASDPVSVARVS